MPAKQYLVNLTQDEREHLLAISRRGKSSARKVKRSLILCKAGEGATDRQVAEALMVGPSTVSRVRGGSAPAHHELQPRPSHNTKVGGTVIKSYHIEGPVTEGKWGSRNQCDYRHE